MSLNNANAAESMRMNLPRAPGRGLSRERPNSKDQRLKSAQGVEHRIVEAAAGCNRFQVMMMSHNQRWTASFAPWRSRPGQPRRRCRIILRFSVALPARMYMRYARMTKFFKKAIRLGRVAHAAP